MVHIVSKDQIINYLLIISSKFSDKKFKTQLDLYSRDIKWLCNYTSNPVAYHGTKLPIQNNST